MIFWLYFLSCFSILNLLIFALIFIICLLSWCLLTYSIIGSRVCLYQLFLVFQYKCFLSNYHFIYYPLIAMYYTFKSSQSMLFLWTLSIRPRDNFNKFFIEFLNTWIFLWLLLLISTFLRYENILCIISVGFYFLFL